MITQLHLENFKSWRDTTPMRFAPLTGFFGVNSSGKTSILQFLMMMKQTAESRDHSRVLHTGDKNSYIDLGTFYDLVHNHQMPGRISFAIGWDLDERFEIGQMAASDRLSFEAIIEGDTDNIRVIQFIYNVGELKTVRSRIGVKRKARNGGYSLIYEQEGDLKQRSLYDMADFRLSETAVDYQPTLTAPMKSYIFPKYGGSWPLHKLAAAFERLMATVFYLGPLREYPHRFYSWSGEHPQDVGVRGEWAIDALLTSPLEVREQVARWLKKVGLIYSFELRLTAPNRREYEVMVRLSPQATEVPITDVGFGVSQILPVLTLCHYVPEKSIIILEQPEIHLHPAVQANLADLFIDVIKTRRVQIILESHSEHLLRRLQRRIAEEKLQPEQVALYFTSIQDGASRLAELDIDSFGNIRNWPENFFGDELGDLAAMTEAAMRRKLNGGSV